MPEWDHDPDRIPPYRPKPGPMPIYGYLALAFVIGCIVFYLYVFRDVLRYGIG